MLWKLMFKSDFLSAIEFDGRTPTFTINDVKVVKLEGEDGKVKDKGVVFFSETQRGFVLCKTNAICLAAMFGDNTDTWLGKRVTLFATDVKVGADTKPGIRIKGSPDLKQAMGVDIKLPKKKAFKMQLATTTSTPPASNTEKAA